MRKLIIIFLVLIANATIAQRVRYQVCTNCPNNWSFTQTGSMNVPAGGFAYEEINSFEDSHVVSDFGKRESNSRWHIGVDFSRIGGNEDAGDRLYPVEGGAISLIKGSNTYKVAFINGENRFAYGHLFNDGTVGNSSLRSGDFILKKMDFPHNNFYAIIYAPQGEDPVVFGQVTGRVTEATLNEGGSMLVQTFISEHDPIGPIGNSGGGFEAHLHLYSFLNTPVVADISSDYYHRDRRGGFEQTQFRNVKDPLQFMTHTEPIYSIELSSELVYPGNLNSSIRARATMIGERGGGAYSSSMNIDNVDLFIKQSQDDFSEFALIEGSKFESKISHGGRTTSDRYPSINFPETNSGENAIDIARGIRNGIDEGVGSVSRTGIFGSAYNRQPRDDFFFSDIYLRIHKDHQLGSETFYARINGEAKYPDGSYDIYSRVTTVTGNFHVGVSEEIVIDNFKPYVRKVSVYSSETGTFYDKQWNWDASGGTLDFSPDLGNVQIPSINQPIEVTIVISEPMKEVKVSIPTLGINNAEATSSGSGFSDQNWFYIIDGSSTSGGIHEIQITGLDLNNNEIQIDPTQIPIHSANGIWEGTVNAGADRNHSFELFDGSCSTPSGGRSNGNCPLIADFNHQMHPSYPLTVNFSSLSSPTNDITSWSWSFGDGNTSTSVNPIHQYNSEGTYLTTLTVFRGTEQNSYSKNITVSNDLNPIFTISPSSGNVPLIASLNSSASTGIITDRSWIITPVSGWFFSQGDQTSVSPTVEFYEAGIYQVKLRIGDGFEVIDSAPQTVKVQTGLDPIANFEWNAPVYVSGPISFRDRSFFPCISGLNYGWDFGDGSNSTSSDPVHTYTSVGDYSVQLCIEDGCGAEDCITKTVHVDEFQNNVFPAFSANTYTIKKGQTVTFTDESTPINGIALWTWWFEDPADVTTRPSGQADESYLHEDYEQNVTHQYDEVGEYRVSLGVTADIGEQGPWTSTIIKVIDTEEIVHSQKISSAFSNKKIKDVKMSGDYIAVVVDESSWDYVYIYKQNNNFFSKVAEIRDHDIDKIGFNGQILAAASADQAGVEIYERGEGEWINRTNSDHRLNINGFSSVNSLPSVKTFEMDISANDEIAIVTSERINYNSNNSYSSYIYIARKDGLGIWPSDYTQRISLGTSNDQKTSDVAISGNTLVAKNGFEPKIFEKSGSWSLSASLSSSLFLRDIDVYGNTVVGSFGPISSNWTFGNPLGYVWDKPYDGIWKNNQSPNAELSNHFDTELDGASQAQVWSISITNTNITLISNFGSYGNVAYTYEKRSGVWNSMKEDYILEKDGLQHDSWGNEIVIYDNNELRFYDLETYCRSDVYSPESFTLTAGNWPAWSYGAISLAGYYVVQQNPQRIAIIASGANINMEANTITLKSGFHAKSGSTVRMTAVTCEELSN